MIMAKNIAPYIVTSTDRKNFQLLNEHEKSECMKMKNNMIVCESPRVFKNNHYSQCEWNVLNKLGIQDCEFDIIESKFMWIQLAKLNHWIYATINTEKINTVCKDQTEYFEIGGIGLLILNPKCVINTKTLTIYGHDELESELKIKVPSMQYNAATLAPINFERITVTSSKIEFEKIDKTLRAMKEQTKFEQIQHIHHFTFSAILITIILICIFFKLYSYKRKPKPAPRNMVVDVNRCENNIRAISMPQLNFVAGENVQT